MSWPYPARTRSGAAVALVAYAPRAGFAARASDALRRRFVLGAVIAMTLAIVVSLAVASLVSRRVRRLAAAAGTIAGGDFDHPLNGRFPDEIGRLATASTRCASGSPSHSRSSSGSVAHCQPF